MVAAMADSETWKKTDIKIVEKKLIALLKSWHSRYRYVISLKSTERKKVKFDTMWCRRPTPHQPVPDVRINVEFCFRFSSKDKGLQQPQITYRIEHESLVLKDLKNIDYHVLRVIKMKTRWLKDNEFPLENAGVLDTRLVYNETSADDLIGPPPNTLTSGLEDQQREEEALQLEEVLIKMFTSSDDDKNGHLDSDEFSRLLLASDLGFTEGAVKVILSAYDKNSDGMLVYTEFIPVAVDVIQAQRAQKYADEMDEKTTEEAYENAEKRIDGFEEQLLEAVSNWSDYDKDETGFLAEESVRQLILDLPIKLSTGSFEEVEMLMMKMDLDEDTGELSYTEFVDNHEKMLLEVMQDYHLEEHATEVELYLRHLFYQKDEENTGLLPRAELVDVLKNSKRIYLTTVQVHAIMGIYIDDDEIDYKDFSRRTALLIYRLFNRQNLNAKKSAIQRSSITPVELLAGNTRNRVAAQMRAKFREFDNDDDGYLELAEFHRCIADTSLCFSKKQIDDLYKKAASGDDKISIENFMKFAYGTLLHLARNAALKHHFQQKV